MTPKGEFRELVGDTGSRRQPPTPTATVAAEHALRLPASRPSTGPERVSARAGCTSTPRRRPSPTSPAGLSATASNGQVVLTWDDPDDDSITGYVILRRVRVNDTGGDFSELVADTGAPPPPTPTTRWRPAPPTPTGSRPSTSTEPASAPAGTTSALRQPRSRWPGLRRRGSHLHRGRQEAVQPAGVHRRWAGLIDLPSPVAQLPGQRKSPHAWQRGAVETKKGPHTQTGRAAVQFPRGRPGVAAVEGAAPMPNHPCSRRQKERKPDRRGSRRNEAEASLAVQGEAQPRRGVGTAGPTGHIPEGVGPPQRHLRRIPLTTDSRGAQSLSPAYPADGCSRPWAWTGWDRLFILEPAGE